MVRKINTLLFLFLITSFMGNAQKFGMGGSFDIMNPVRRKVFLPGISVFFDVPKSANVAFYGKVGFYFPSKSVDSSGQVQAINPSTSPYILQAKNVTSISNISLQGGTKYFIGNDYNVGFSGQFDTHVRLLISPSNTRVSGYDKSLYEPVNSQGSTTSVPAKYTSFALYAGVGAGAKYSQPWGTLFATAGLDILIFYYQPNALTSQFLLNFQIGYRRDIY